MKKSLLTLRYYLEIIALPAFIFLVIHLAGHGLMVFVEGEAHDHGSHGHHHEQELDEEDMKHLVSSYSHSREREECEKAGGNWLDEFYECEYVGPQFCGEELGGSFEPCTSACRHDPEAQICTKQCVPVCAVNTVNEDGHMIDMHSSEDHNVAEQFLQSLFTVEILSGILLLIFFDWLWHRPAFRKWVPCSHEHCHDEIKSAHILAIVALCLHFFPEAGIRKILLTNAFIGDITNILGLIGFAAHFLVDVIIGLMLSSYFSTKQGFWISFGSIVIVWVIAFWFGEHAAEHISAAAEGVIFLISAFLLAMFVHKPHKPVTECKHCEH